MFKRIDHVLVAVKDLQESLALYQEKLGLQPSEVRTAEDLGLREAYLPLGNAQLVLSQPTGQEGPVARFLEQRGEGLYLIALEVEDLDGAIKTLREKGARLIEDRPSGGRRMVFVHPKSAHGVLLQLIERPGAGE